MGMRFQRRVTIAPGVRVNLGMRGASLSMGPRGASVSVGRRGVYSNVGIPGTGLSHRQKLGSFGNSGHSASAARALAQEEKRLERTRLALEARFEIDDKGKVHVLSETGELLTGAARTEFWKTRASEVTQALSALLEEEETRLLGVLEVGQQDLSNEVPTY
ncbi:MAG: DUF4236 domain-containing protein, partial [Oricola sp.]|nr:DUF4236 domain-containing protein [Oricola sp.]